MTDIHKELEKLRDTWRARARDLAFTATESATTEGIVLRQCANDLDVILEAEK